MKVLISKKNVSGILGLCALMFALSLNFRHQLNDYLPSNNNILVLAHAEECCGCGGDECQGGNHMFTCYRGWRDFGGPYIYMYCEPESPFCGGYVMGIPVSEGLTCKGNY
jgi:hypothetical protein